MVFHRVFTYEKSIRKIRLFRIRWGKHPADPGSTHMVSVALQPSLFRFNREYNGYRLTLIGVNIHFQGGSRGCLV